MNRPKQPFFRPEVTVARQTSLTGKVILTRPLSFSLWTTFASISALLIILFLIFGNYTRKTTVEGQILPASGVIRVYAPDTGTITTKFVEDGEKVKAGDKLFALSTSRFGAGGSVQQQLKTEAVLKKTLAEQELGRLKLIHENETRSLKATVERLENQKLHISQQIDGQKRRIRLAEEMLQKYRFLSANDAVPKQEMMNVKAELLEQKAKLDAYRREEVGLLQEIRTQNLTLASLPQAA